MQLSSVFVTASSETIDIDDILFWIDISEIDFDYNGMTSVFVFKWKNLQPNNEATKKLILNKNNH